MEIGGRVIKNQWTPSISYRRVREEKKHTTMMIIYSILVSSSRITFISCSFPYHYFLPRHIGLYPAVEWFFFSLRKNHPLQIFVYLDHLLTSSYLMICLRSVNVCILRWDLIPQFEFKQSQFYAHFLNIIYRSDSAGIERPTNL